MNKLKTIDIKGTAYVTVNARLKHFRENYRNYRLITEISKHDDDSCLIKASVIDENNNVISTGHAYERTSQGFINKTSHVENCETSAVGRALAIFGIGIDEEVRSYEEMSSALEGQKTPKKKKEKQSVCATEETIKKEDLETMLQECNNIDEVIEIWWLLTKEQQNDKDIKFWFEATKNTLKEQSNG